MPTVHHLTGPRGPLSWNQVATGLEHDAQLALALTAQILADAPKAVFWECTPSSARHRDAPFAFVCNPAPALDPRPPDPVTFAHELVGAELVGSFPNLQGDAWLVVPTALGEDRPYPHLSTFLRTAPETQILALWAEVGRQVQRWWRERLDEPVWTSTSGLGVTWLHVRLDQRPKYYTHAPFRRAPDTFAAG